MLTRFSVIHGATVALGLVMLTSTAAFAQTAASHSLAASADQATLQHNAAAAAERSLIQARIALAAKDGAAVSANRSVRTSASNPGTDGQVISNGFRAYPDSCLSNPLPTATSGPVYSTPVVLAAYNGTNTLVPETVTMQVWRVACVSLTGQSASAMLMRIQRQAELTTQYPLFPSVRMAQGSVGFDDPNFLDIIRIGLEPNTVISTVYPDDPVVTSTTYVLEYIPDTAYDGQNYNNALSLRYDNLEGNQYVVNIPAYAPTVATYPAAFQPMPISGYQSGNWITTLNHENMLVQVYEIPNNTTQRAFLFSWVAYAADGTPLYIEGNAIYPLGATSVASPAIIVTANGSQATWGNVTFSFNDCNTAQFTYNNTSGLAGPVGTGSRTWNRLLNLYINGIVCQ